MNNGPRTPQDAIAKGRTDGTADILRDQAEQARLRAVWEGATRQLEEGFALLRDQQGSTFAFNAAVKDPSTRMSVFTTNAKGPDGGALEAVVDRDGKVSLYEYAAGNGDKKKCMTPQIVMHGAKDPNVPLMVVTRLAVTRGLVR